MCVETGGTVERENFACPGKRVSFLCLFGLGAFLLYMVPGGAGRASAVLLSRPLGLSCSEEKRFHLCRECRLGVVVLLPLRCETSKKKGQTT